MILSARESLVAVAIQSIGPVSYFTLILIIARLFGPAVQGEFAIAKAWIDFLIALFVFGLPQSYTYSIQKLNVNSWHLARLTLRLTPVIALLTIVASFAGAKTALADSTLSGIAPVTLLGVAITLGTLSELFKGILLAHDDGPTFSFSVVVQPLALALMLASLGIIGVVPSIPLIILCSFLMALVVTVFFMETRIERTRRNELVEPVGTPRLLRIGAHSFAQGVCMTLLPLSTIWILKWAGTSQADIGIWSVAAAIFLAAASPLAMVAPLLFSRWARKEHVDSINQAAILAARSIWYFGALAALLATLSYWIVPLVFGSEFSGAVIPGTILLLSLPCTAYSRISAPAIFASGNPGILTNLLGLRLLVGLTVIFLLIRSGQEPLLSAALGWAASEFALAISAHAWLHKQAN